MKIKNSIQFNLLIIIGLVLIPIYGCEKDEKSLKKYPIITWGNPTDISYGTLLSITQLNATADVPGTFVYTPAIGTKLNEGLNQDLIVDFTPTDIENYYEVSKTININVTTPITVTDIDGNVYHTVTIGTQVWMVENLKTTKYKDGGTIPNIADFIEWGTLTTPAYCCYNNDAATNKATYGVLYNWYTVNTGKLAPTGWHVPTNAEWTTLENYLIANGYNYDGTTTGDRSTNNKIAKALASATGWSSDDGTGTIGNNDYPAKRNATDFNALPGGYCSIEGTFHLIGATCHLWSSSESNSGSAWSQSMSSPSISVDGGYDNKRYGFSVRCLRD